jgi:hypothetical protein
MSTIEMKGRGTFANAGTVPNLDPTIAWAASRTAHSFIC